MDKEQTIAALQEAAGIEDKEERNRQFQIVLKEFEGFLKRKTPSPRIQNDSFHTLSTPAPDSVTNPSRRRGGQRAIPKELVPMIDKWHRGGWGYGDIANYLRQEYGLSVDRTTIKNVIRRKGVYQQ